MTLRQPVVPTLTALFASLLTTACSDSDECETSVCNCSSTPFEREEEASLPASALAERGISIGDAIALEPCRELCEEALPSWRLGDDIVGCVDGVLGSGPAGGAGQGGNHATPVNFTCIVEVSPLCVGRRHASVLAERKGYGQDEVAAWLGSATRDEAASVAAFELLAEELAAHGAPLELVEAARDAADDELRHAVLMGGLARESGALATTPMTVQRRERSLFALAYENVVEGCVGETFAALLNHHQALRAPLPAWREVFGEIAADELRHAELSWRIHVWAWPRLDRFERAELHRAMERTVDRMEHPAALTPDTRRRLGLPTPERSRRLVGLLRSRLWS
ncbi:MAG: ferritin-like domain-containing protein [Myxococcota bacterium]